MSQENDHPDHTPWPKIYLGIALFNIVLIICFFLIRSQYNVT